MKTDNRTDKRKTGDKGERRAARYLMLRGYRIIERNYTFGHKEVDLIARRGRTLAFVEVKTRKDDSILSGRYSVTLAKRHNIISAAKAYCMNHDASGMNIRFDIAEVSTKGSVNYIKNAYSEG